MNVHDVILRMDQGCLLILFCISVNKFGQLVPLISNSVYLRSKRKVT